MSSCTGSSNFTLSQIPHNTCNLYPLWLQSGANSPFIFGATSTTLAQWWTAFCTCACSSPRPIHVPVTSLMGSQSGRTNFTGLFSPGYIGFLLGDCSRRPFLGVTAGVAGDILAAYRCVLGPSAGGGWGGGGVRPEVSARCPPSPAAPRTLIKSLAARLPLCSYTRHTVTSKVWD